MSKFYASVENNRSIITKCGHKDGFTAHLRGWSVGVKVIISYDEKTKIETYEVYKTGGSNGNKPTELIMSFTDKD